MEDLSLAEMEQFALERVRIHWREHFFTDPDVSVTLDAISRKAVLRLAATIYAEKHDSVEKVYFSKPKTWWDAFKEEFFPAWLLKRYPARYETIEKQVNVRQTAYYPKLPLALEPGPVCFHTRAEVGPTIRIETLPEMNLVSFIRDVGYGAKRIEMHPAAINSLYREMERISDCAGAHGGYRWPGPIIVFGCRIEANKNIPTTEVRIWECIP